MSLPVLVLQLLAALIIKNAVELDCAQEVTIFCHWNIFNLLIEKS